MSQMLFQELYRNEQIMNKIIPAERITGKIYQIRNQKVMLDRDLAELYGAKTRVLKQAVN